MKNLFAACLIAALPTPALGQETVYRCDDDGRLIYTSKPREGVECIAIGTHSPSRWDFVAKGLNGAQVTVDKETIRRDKHIVSAWVQYSHPEGRALWAGRASRTMLREEMDCRTGTVAVTTFIAYAEDGHILDSSNYQGTHTPVVPDSIHEATWRYLCNGAQQQQQ